MHRSRLVLWALVGWTLFVWANRIRNIWADDALTASGQLGRSALALSFVLPALVLGATLLRRRWGRWFPWFVRAFAAWTVGVWVVRMVGIALHGHDVGFVVVHLVLAALSSVLAVAAWRTTIPAVMGQPITAIEKPAARHGMVRFDLNRNLTGMDHERYVAGQEIDGQRPPDELARRLFAHGGVASVAMIGNVVTVDLADGHSSEGLREVIEGLYTFYREGVAPAAVAE
ncbi:MAG TPA: hypothetical protein PKA98_14625 [Acidimicrobiales bacterium]|nr:hypothetical protein [Acidimicrobiales bacterium]